VRRIVATLLVVASPALMAVPADAGDGRAARPAAPTAASTVPVPTAVLAAPEVVAPLAIPAPVAVTPAIPAPAAPKATAVRPVVRTVRAKAPAAVDADAVYAARLHAELCHARAVFCGLDRSGRYPTS
jgi:hypothetical protein